MNKVLTVIGGILVFVGLMMMAGSANDCDGACMEQANTIGEMILVALLGIGISASGGFLVYLGGKDGV
jgi:hypothetical protein